MEDDVQEIPGGLKREDPNRDKGMCMKKSDQEELHTKWIVRNERQPVDYVLENVADSNWENILQFLMECQVLPHKA